MYIERVELTVTVDEDHDTDEVVPCLTELGLEDCASHRIVSTIIGYLAVTDDYSKILEQLREVPGVTWVGGAIVAKAIDEDSN